MNAVALLSRLTNKFPAAIVSIRLESKGSAITASNPAAIAMAKNVLLIKGFWQAVRDVAIPKIEQALMT